MEKVKPKFDLGDLVVIKSYPKELIDNEPLTGDPLHVPPIMCVIEVEVEDKKKKTHDSVLGKQIAERVKYKLIWFDNKKSEFVEKIIYESMLSQIINESKNLSERDYEYARVVMFKTKFLELEKEKKTSNTSSTKDLDSSDENRKNKERENTTSLVTYASPDFVMSGIKRNEEVEKYSDKGEFKRKVSNSIIKIMWFNPHQQKYSEYELPIECLTLNTDKKE